MAQAGAAVRKVMVMEVLCHALVILIKSYIDVKMNNCSHNWSVLLSVSDNFIFDM